MGAMPRRLWLGMWCFALTWVASAACGEDRPPIVWEGEHLRFGTHEDTTICEGTLPYMDAYVGYLGDLFERPHARVDYYWVSTDESDAHCSMAGRGCASGREVFSQYALHMHELVHAARDGAHAYLPLEEGIADLYGDELHWQLLPQPSEMLSFLKEHERGRVFSSMGRSMSAMR